MLIRRASALGWLALFPIATAFGLAVAHVLPIGIRFDTWFFPSLALACGGAVDEVVRRLPRVLTVASLLAMATVVVIMVNGLPYPEVRPSFRPVAAAAAAIPPSECVVLDKVHLAQWAWDTRWDIEILGQVPGDTWAVIGFPGRCVSIPGYGPEWTGSSVLHTLDPPGERVWWIHPTGARGAVPESLVLDSETNHNGFTITSFVRR